MAEATPPTGPDFSQGVRIDDIPAQGVLGGRVGDDPVLLSIIDGAIFAVSGRCTHYGAALEAGLVDGETIRCPLHHACFSLRTGAALAAPAFDGLDRWVVEIEPPLVFVRQKAAAISAVAPAPTPAEVETILIVGGGAAGLACAAKLRELGFQGSLTMASADADPPCDRPNLSKDYLAGTAPEEWIPLRDRSWFDDAAIDLRLDTEIVTIDPSSRRAISGSGEVFSFDRLLLATGSEPVRLGSPGFERDNVHTLRSLADARAIIARAAPGSRAAIIGSSFLGLESAAALRTRGIDVAIVSTDTIPFAGLFGRDIGLFVQRLHQDKGVRFHLGCSAAGFDGSNLRLDNGQKVGADFVLAAVGVRPRTGLSAPGLAIADGYLVDRYLATTIPGIYAAGDAAAYPDPLRGRPTRIEHWVTAQRQGQTAALNMLGIPTRYDAIPFFWTEHYGTALRYVGGSRHWDEVRIDGDVWGGDFIALYYEQGELRAAAACGRDRELLEVELALESLAAAAGDGNAPHHAPPQPGTFASARHPM